jgi:hypothetical protein
MRAGGIPWAGRDPPPLRFGAAWSASCQTPEIGRDVGLAKSGLRPSDFGTWLLLQELARLSLHERH